MREVHTHTLRKAEEGVSRPTSKGVSAGVNKHESRSGVGVGVGLML